MSGKAGDPVYNVGVKIAGVPFLSSHPHAAESMRQYPLKRGACGWAALLALTAACRSDTLRTEAKSRINKPLPGVTALFGLGTALQGHYAARSEAGKRSFVFSPLSALLGLAPVAAALGNSPENEADRESYGRVLDVMPDRLAHDIDASESDWTLAHSIIDVTNNLVRSWGKPSTRGRQPAPHLFSVLNQFSTSGTNSAWQDYARLLGTAGANASVTASTPSPHQTKEVSLRSYLNLMVLWESKFNRTTLQFNPNPTLNGRTPSGGLAAQRIDGIEATLAYEKFVVGGNRVVAIGIPLLGGSETVHAPTMYLFLQDAFRVNGNNLPNAPALEALINRNQGTSRKVTGHLTLPKMRLKSQAPMEHLVSAWRLPVAAGDLPYISESAYLADASQKGFLALDSYGLTTASPAEQHDALRRTELAPSDDEEPPFVVGEPFSFVLAYPYVEHNNAGAPRRMIPVLMGYFAGDQTEKPHRGQNMQVVMRPEEVGVSQHIRVLHGQ